VALGANANTIEVDAAGLDGDHSNASVQVEYPFIHFEDFQYASVVIGQADALSFGANRGVTAGADTLAFPLGRVLPFGGKLFVPDSDNSRLLVFDSVPTTSGSSASIVLGQPDFSSMAGDTTAATWTSPLGVAAAGDELLVADARRVLIFSSMPTQSGAAANLVEGWDDFGPVPAEECAPNRISRAAGIWIANGKLLVADSHNNRVLIWNSIPTRSSQAADLALGQADLSHCAANAGGDLVPGDSTLLNPTDVWSDGVRVVVADSQNNRVLIWNSFPTQSGQPASVVLGQTNFTTALGTTTSTGLAQPNSVFSNGNQLFVADTKNNRILVWDTFPSVSGAEANGVLGQADYSHTQKNDDDQNREPDSNPTGRTLSSPAGVALWDDQLFVTDYRNNRVLIFQGTKPTGALPLAP
jgi:hypothetical protein